MVTQPSINLPYLGPALLPLQLQHHIMVKTNLLRHDNCSQELRNIGLGLDRRQSIDDVFLLWEQIHELELTIAAWNQKRNDVDEIQPHTKWDW